MKIRKKPLSVRPINFQKVYKTVVVSTSKETVTIKVQKHISRKEIYASWFASMSSWLKKEQNLAPCHSEEFWYIKSLSEIKTPFPLPEKFLYMSQYTLLTYQLKKKYHLYLQIRSWHRSVCLKLFTHLALTLHLKQEQTNKIQVENLNLGYAERSEPKHFKAATEAGGSLIIT